MRTCKCPNCHADLEFTDNNREYMFCQYCGAKVMLDDYRSTQRVITEQRIIDEGAIARAEAEKTKAEAERIKAETDRTVRLRQLEMQVLEQNRQARAAKYPVIIRLIPLIIISIAVLYYCTVGTDDHDYIMQTIVLIEFPAILFTLISISKLIRHPSGKSAPEKPLKELETEYISFPNPKSLIGKHYASVERRLINLGFTNVVCKEVRRSGFSLIRKKDIVDIRVYGESISMEKKTRRYPSDTKIEILY